MAPTFYISTTVSAIILIAVIILLYKGVRVKKRQTCPRNQWTAIISNFGTGYPRTFDVTFTSTTGENIAGKYTEQRFLWVFPGGIKEGNLESKVTFHRNWLNGRYKVKIFPHSDVEVTIK